MQTDCSIPIAVFEEAAVSILSPTKRDFFEKVRAFSIGFALDRNGKYLRTYSEHPYVV